MARFDLLTDNSKRIPYFLDVQSDFLSHLPTRLVIPVVLPEMLAGTMIQHLQLPLIFRDRSLVIATNQLTSVPLRQCGKAQGSLADRSYEITAAIDFLLQGF